MGQKQADIEILCWENKGEFQALIVLFQREGGLKMCILCILDLANILLPSYAKTSAFSLVKSRLALGSPGCLVGCHHAKNGLMHGKMVVVRMRKN